MFSLFLLLDGMRLSSQEPDYSPWAFLMIISYNAMTLGSTNIHLTLTERDFSYFQLCDSALNQ